MTHRARRLRFVVCGAVVVVAALYAGGRPALAQRSRAAQTPAPAPTDTGAPVERLVLLAGRSMVLPMAADIERFSFTDPDIADGLAVSRRELLINGKKPGTISLMVWSGGRMVHYELVIDSGTPSLQQRLQALFPGEDIQVTMVGTAVVLSGRASTQAVVDGAGEIAVASGIGSKVLNFVKPPDGEAVPELQHRLHVLFPGENIEVSVSGKAVILSGAVSTQAVLDRAAEIAQSSDPDKHVINLLKQTSAATSQQVMLQVRFAEVSHRALTELGLSLAGGTGKIDARSSTQQFAAPGVGSSATSTTLPNDPVAFGDLLNLFFFSRQQNIGAVIKALQQHGSFQSLAEPNLIAYNDKDASFLAGGQIPVPIVSPTGGVSFDYKPFGVSLKFRPTILGDMIHLKLRPEVSRLDFPNGVIYQGVPIPALTTRWAETEVELHDGQSFAVAGLMDNSGTEDKRAVPILSKIPILGALFRSKSKGEDRMELLVLITPHLVQPLNPDQLPPLPKIIKKDGGTR